MREMRYAPLVLVALLAAGCAGLWGTRHGVSSSLVDFLYPDGQQPPPAAREVPHLDLPVRVGIAFVPPAQPDDSLSEVHKTELLNNVKKAFANRDFISAIEVVPETYLRSSRGFGTVDQVARLYQLDVFALVSYDQVAVTDDTKASLAYWTIVGAYFIKGNANDVQTFVDTAVFDVKTHALLFRAAGTDTSHTSSTLVNTPEVVRGQRVASFDTAMADMTRNLAQELDVFRERVKNEQVATVSNRGGGSLDALCALALALVLVHLLRRRAADA